MAKKNSGFIGGLAIGAVATILVGSAFTEYWLYGKENTADLQPAAGGMQLVETPAPAPVAQPQPPAEATATPNPFNTGGIATTTDALRLYADAARSSLVLNVIAQGESVTITEARATTQPIQWKQTALPGCACVPEMAWLAGWTVQNWRFNRHYGFYGYSSRIWQRFGRQS